MALVNKEGGAVEEIIGKKETLEEAFLRRIEADEKRRKEGEGS